MEPGIGQAVVRRLRSGTLMDNSLKSKILELLDQHRIMTIATLRPDGWPQATTVGYTSQGLILYFLCAANLAREHR